MVHSTQAIEAGKAVAMQVAAMNPLAIEKGDLDTTVLDKELAIARGPARYEGNLKL